MAWKIILIKTIFEARYDTYPEPLNLPYSFKTSMDYEERTEDLALQGTFKWPEHVLL